jgi:hypothetical protein
LLENSILAAIDPHHEYLVACCLSNSNIAVLDTRENQYDKNVYIKKF